MNIPIYVVTTTGKGVDASVLAFNTYEGAEECAKCSASLIHMPRHTPLAGGGMEGYSYLYKTGVQIKITKINFEVPNMKVLTDEEIERKLYLMESRTVPGFLLEWQNDKGEWVGSEFEPCSLAGSNMWGNEAFSVALNEWYKDEIEIGFFAALPNVWFASSSDWDFRLGVNFDARHIPVDNGHNGVWEGTGHEGKKWRVSFRAIAGTLSEKARAFIRRHPEVTFDYAK